MTSLYHQSVPVLTKYLRNLSTIVAKGAKFAEENGKKPEEILEYRLIEDMRGLPFQIQACCNTAKFLVSRIGSLPDTHFPDDETTFAQLQDRIDATISLLEAADPRAFDGREEEEVIMETRMGKFRFTGQSYVSEFAIPNFHFHLTSAYCILRTLGVELGAMDYLGGVFRKV